MIFDLLLRMFRLLRSDLRVQAPMALGASTQFSMGSHTRTAVRNTGCTSTPEFQPLGYTQGIAKPMPWLCHTGRCRRVGGDPIFLFLYNAEGST